MRTIAHISDLHFGAEDPVLVEALVGDLTALRPDVVAVSELTQRARRDEFLAARAFLDRLPSPVVAVPGNHDVPLFNPWRRFRAPLTDFRRFVSNDLFPTYADEEIAMLGLATARSNVVKGGRLSRDQIALLDHRLCLAAPDVTRVLVTHHPFMPPPDHEHVALVGRGRDALEAAESCRLDLILSGHQHVEYGADVLSLAAYRGLRRSVLVFQAGTATSVRTRGEPNGYNVLVVDGPLVRFEARHWDGTAFVPYVRRTYRRDSGRWLQEAV